jgi:UDP:flavonoid glycosyltransferase YjiC (YdhE family)
MSRIVLTTLGSLGDLHPFIALGLGLRDRGHTITIATSEFYRPKIEGLGLGFHPMRPELLLEDPQLAELTMDLKKGTERVLKEFILGSLRETYEDLMAIAQQADYLITHEVVYATPLVAELLKLPWATIILSPASFFSAYDPLITPTYPALAKLRRFGPRVNRWVLDFLRFLTRDWGEAVHQLRQELGLPPVKHPIIDDKYSPDLVLGLFASVLGAPQPDWPPNVVVTGFTLYDGNREQSISTELQAFLEAGDPPLVFTLGSAAVNTPGNFYSESIEAAIRLDRRAVLLMGKNSLPKDLPSSIFASDYVPYSAIFPQACAIIHQGGIGTTSQGLRSGRPTIVMPYSHDQPDNAARLARLGVSRTIPRVQYTAKRVEKELRSLFSNPAYSAKAAAIGKLMESENGVAIACDALENKLMGDRSS